MAPRGKHYIKGTVSQYFLTETLRWLEVGSYKLGCTAGNVSCYFESKDSKIIFVLLDVGTIMHIYYFQCTYVVFHSG